MVYHSPFVDFFYEIIGVEGKTPILFLHGWGGDGRSFLQFAKKFQDRKCILVDFPPFGKSSEPICPLSITLYAKLVIKILIENDIKDFYIVAHSFGARVSYEMCKLGVVPRKMVITGGAGIKRRRSFVTKCKIIKYKVIKYLCRRGLLNFKKLDKFGSEEYLALNPTSRETFVNVTNYDQTPFLKYICCPTLLFWGKKDKVTPFCFTKIYKKHIKDCGVVGVNGGHFAYLQNSGLFLQVLYTFLI